MCWTTALDDDGVSYGRPGRCASIRRPRCIDRMEVIVRRKRVYVRVYPLVVYRRGCGDGRSMGCCKCRNKDGGFCDAR